MAYDGLEFSPVVLDLETMPLPNAADYLEPVTAARNLVDPVKIKADIAAKTEAREEKLALDRNVGRIAAIGWWTSEGGFFADVCKCEGDEASLLQAAWKVMKGRPLIGYNAKNFDVPYMIQRSRYLGIKHPNLDLGKYSKRDITDLYLELTFYEGKYDEGAMRRTLHAFCKRFGIPVDDDLKGSDIPALAQAGEWGQVEAHVRSDVALTVALAQRLGLVKADERVTA